MKSTKVKKKIAGALHGITFPQNDSRSDIAIRYHRYDRHDRPPSYMIRMSLDHLAGCSILPGGDKSAWQAVVVFEENSWHIADFRRRYWILSGPPNQHEQARLLVRKLTAASRILDGMIKSEGKELLHKDRIALQNNFQRAKALYDFSRERCDEVIEKINNPNLVDDISHENELQFLANIFQRGFALDQSLEANCLAAVVFFFGMTEVILDCMFSLGDRQNYTFNSFRQLDWSERLRLFVDVSSGAAQDAYQHVIDIKKTYRNFGAHAAPTILVPVSTQGIGLIPMTYDDLDKPSMNLFSALTPSTVHEIFASFDALLKILTKHSLGQFALRYAESGLPILIEQSAADSLRQLLGDPTAFEDELRRREEYQCALDNMDI